MCINVTFFDQLWDESYPAQRREAVTLRSTPVTMQTSRSSYFPTSSHAELHDPFIRIRTHN